MTFNGHIKINSAVCYLRRSRQDVEREKRTGEDTLSTQKKIMTRVLEQMDISYTIAEEIGSGDKIESRPVFQKILHWLEMDKHNAVAVKEIARLGRGSYSDMGVIFDLITEKRIYIITPYKIYDIENPSDARQVRFEMFFAREEFEMIRERMLSSKTGLAYEGRWVLGAAPFGYKLNRKTTRLEKNEEYAPLIRLIFDLFVYGRQENDGRFQEMSIQETAYFLNSMGIPTPRGGSCGWKYITVKRILENPAYAGILNYKKRKRIGSKYYNRPKEEWIIAEHAHEPLVSRDTWEKAQNKLAGKNPPNSCNTPRAACELAGIVYCAKCGKKMTRQNNTRNYTKKDGSTSVYRKEFLWCTTKNCSFVKYREVENNILKFLSRVTLDPGEFSSALEKIIKENNRQQANLNIKIGDLTEKAYLEIERKMNFIFHKYEQGILNDEEFTARKNILEREKGELKKVENKDTTTAPLTGISIAEIKTPAELYRGDFLNRKEKNMLLKTLIEKIYVLKTGRGTFETVIHPCFPIKRM